MKKHTVTTYDKFAVGDIYTFEGRHWVVTGIVFEYFSSMYEVRPATFFELLKGRIWSLFRRTGR